MSMTDVDIYGVDEEALNWGSSSDLRSQEEEENSSKHKIKAKETLSQFIRKTDKPISECDVSITTHDLIDIAALILSDRESSLVRDHILRDPERLDIILKSEQNLRALCLKLYDKRTESFWKLSSTESDCDGWSIGHFLLLIQKLENDTKFIERASDIRLIMNDICKEEAKSDPLRFDKVVKDLSSELEYYQTSSIMSEDHFNQAEFKNQMELDFLQFIEKTDKPILQFKYNVEIQRIIESIDCQQLRNLQYKKFMDNLIYENAMRACSCKDMIVREELIKRPERFDPIFNSYEKTIAFCKIVYQNRTNEFWIKKNFSRYNIHGWTVNHFNALSESLKLYDRKYKNSAEAISVFVTVSSEEEKKAKRSKQQIVDIKIQRMLNDELALLGRTYENARNKIQFLRELCVNPSEQNLCLLEKIDNYDKRLKVAEKAIKLPSKRAGETQAFMKRQIDPSSPYLAEELLTIM